MPQAEMPASSSGFLEGTEVDMRASVSELKLHIECPMKRYYRYELRRGRHDKAHALQFGDLFHWEMASLLDSATLRPMPEATREALTEYNTYVAALPRWRKPEDWEVIF